MKKTIKAWAAFDYRNILDWDTIWPRKKGVEKITATNYFTSWQDCHDKLGYRIHRITIIVED